jgi:hypothetical protein
MKSDKETIKALRAEVRELKKKLQSEKRSLREVLADSFQRAGYLVKLDGWPNEDLIWLNLAREKPVPNRITVDIHFDATGENIKDVHVARDVWEETGQELILGWR